MESERPANDYLRRLDPGAYKAEAYVHWTMTIHERQTGWLRGLFYYRFRELLTHIAFRYHLACPLYCCMPDHLHLLWIGLTPKSDQRIAMQNFRRHVNEALGVTNHRLQKQAYDHVLLDHERHAEAFETVADYIARNPERRGLVPPDGYATYPFTGCLVPGYPELKPFAPDYWPRFWRTVSYLKKSGFT